MKRLLLTAIAFVLLFIVGCTKHVNNHSNVNYNISYLYFQKCVQADSAGICTKFVTDSVGLNFNTN